MKRLFVALFAFSCLVAVAVAADQPTKVPTTKPAVKTFVFTEAQLKAHDAGVAATALAERDANWEAYFDKEIHSARNWHKAIFRGHEYDIYTGPGQLAHSTPVKELQPIQESQPTKPTTGQASPTSPLMNQPPKISAR